MQYLVDSGRCPGAFERENPNLPSYVMGVLSVSMVLRHSSLADMIMHECSLCEVNYSCPFGGNCMKRGGLGVPASAEANPNNPRRQVSSILLSVKLHQRIFSPKGLLTESAGGHVQGSQLSHGEAVALLAPLLITSSTTATTNGCHLDRWFATHFRFRNPSLSHSTSHHESQIFTTSRRLGTQAYHAPSVNEQNGDAALEDQGSRQSIAHY